MKRLGVFGVLLVVSVAMLGAQHTAPFFGKWKLNAGKTEDPRSSFALSSTSDGAIRFSQADITYTFGLDGKEYPANPGTTESWRQLNDRTWEATVRKDGKVEFIGTFVISPDGGTMTYTIKAAPGVTPELDKPLTFKRTGAGTSLLGTWTPENLDQALGDMSLEITPKPDGGFVYKGWHGTCNEGHFDGKECVLSGREGPRKYTVRFERTGPNAFRMTTYRDGQIRFTELVTAATDGKSLKIESTLSTYSPKTVYGLDRQQ